ncbi:MAG: YIP1 family protein [Tannerella sp.]|jgi:hypothetical protein|nr:YIP1 family protein [Tannerella sp.]
MFRKIFLRIYFIIVHPAREWRVLAEEERESEHFYSSYFHPLLGLIALAAFLGSVFSSRSVETALKLSILEFVVYFAGFYLSSFLLKKIMERSCAGAHTERIPYFAVYASSPVYLISIITSLFGSGSQAVYFFLPYTAYIIWEGASNYMGIEEEKQIRFSGASTLLLLLIPYLIYFIIKKFMLIT